MDSTFIQLSRTVKLSEGNSLKSESGAAVTIESDAHESYPLTEIRSGTYALASLNAGGAKKYRVKIRTSGGDEYLSDFVEEKISPEIDDISWGVKNGAFEVYASTHDDNNKSIYYRWELSETWEFTALYKSEFKSDGKDIVPRNMDTENIYTCWASSTSTPIALGSSAALSKDVIFEQVIARIPESSEKVSKKYSVLVKQYALSKEAYEFWENLKKNTENLGSIFDAQPSQLTGNIHKTGNPTEPVIGFISAGTIQKKRVFVEKEDLPVVETDYPFDCAKPVIIELFLQDRPAQNNVDFWFNSGRLVPLYYAEDADAKIKGYASAPKECADCTIRGANKPPGFWQ